jgi:DNA polymerase-3 subunit delta
MDYGKPAIVEGKEEFLRKTKVNELVNKALPEGITEFNFIKLDAKEISPAELLATIEEIPFGAGKRALVVTDIGKLKIKKGDKATDLLLERLKKGNTKFTTVIFEGESIDKRSAFFKKLIPLCQTFKFDPLREYQLPDFIINYLKDKGYVIDRNAIEFFKFFSTSELMSVTNELDKLILYMGENKTIKENDVRNLLMPSREYTHFDLQDAIIERNLDKALFVGSELLGSGINMLVITAFLEGLFKKALLVKKAQSKTDLNKISRSSFYINKLKTISSSFSEKKLQNLIVLIYKSLIAARKGNLSDSFYLTYLITKIINAMK